MSANLLFFKPRQLWFAWFLVILLCAHLYVCLTCFCLCVCLCLSVYLPKLINQLNWFKFDWSFSSDPAEKNVWTFWNVWRKNRLWVRVGVGSQKVWSNEKRLAENVSRWCTMSGKNIIKIKVTIQRFNVTMQTDAICFGHFTSDDILQRLDTVRGQLAVSPACLWLKLLMPKQGIK